MLSSSSYDTKSYPLDWQCEASNSDPLSPWIRHPRFVFRRFHFTVRCGDDSLNAYVICINWKRFTLLTIQEFIWHSTNLPMMSDQEHTEWLGWTVQHHFDGSWVLEVSHQPSRPPYSEAASGLESSELSKSFPIWVNWNSKKIKANVVAIKLMINWFIPPTD